MRAPLIRQGLWIALLGWALAAGTGRAQDVIATRTQTFRGRVVGVDPQGVRIQLSQGGEVTIPRAAIVQLTVEPPPSIVRGIAAFEKGDLRDAQISLKSILQFTGLDTDWAAKGMLSYGRACLLAGDHANAEKALRVFVEQYPDHPLALSAEIGLAAIELANARYAPALARFEELLAPLAAQLKPAADQLPLAAEIAVGIGKCLEGLERADDAYLAYLRVIGLYPAEPFYSEALYRAGRLQAAAGRWARADQLLGELIEHGTAAEFAAKAVEERKAVKTALAAAGSAAGAAAP